MLGIKEVRIGNRINPIGLDQETPKFSWVLTDVERNQFQASYQVIVGTSAAFDTVMWDSGEVQSQCSSFVEYEGIPLSSRTRYFCKVRVWDRHGRPSDWSDITFFETAFLSRSEWVADWVSPEEDADWDKCVYVKRDFVAEKGVVSARLYITALGLYEAFINGSRVGDDVFTPGWTSYANQIQYQTYDVTGLISEGENALGAVLANGWYKGRLGWKGERNLFGDERALLVQLHIVYKDGHEQVVQSDDRWVGGTGAVVRADIYDGETYDANLEVNWCFPGFEFGHQVPVSVRTKMKSGLVSQINNPTRVVEELRPKEVLTTPSGETVIDMGQNMVGWVKFEVNAPKGTTIRLHHAEVLDREGEFYTDNLRTAKQQTVYICRGEGTEVYEPHFTFQGFRYVKVEGYTGPISVENFTGRVVHTDFAMTGSFECSNEMVNQLYRNIVWGQRGNFVDVPTDCPQRDERLGWTGDAQVFIKTAAFNADIYLFFKKWLRDLRFDQLPSGGVPAVIPHVPSKKAEFLETGHSSSAWADAAVICPWVMYQVYGDVAILEDQYDSMKKWVEYVRRQGTNEFLWDTGFHYGDWLGLDAEEGSYVGATPKELIATAFYAHSTELLAKTADILGRNDDGQVYWQLHAGIVSEFRRMFIMPEGTMVHRTQTAHILPLAFHLANQTQKATIAHELASLIKENGYKLTTGFVGTPYLCDALTENGYHDVACRLVTQTEYPSWLYSITQGATTVWEHWDGIKPDGSFWSANMNSYNHYAYGSIGDWLVSKLAGLNVAAPGYRRILIHPYPNELFSYAKADFTSVLGTIKSEWFYDQSSKEMDIHVESPVNSTTVIVLLGARLEDVVEGKTRLIESQDFSVEVTNDAIRVTVGSGKYHFHYQLA